MARKFFEKQGIRQRRGPLAAGVTFVVYSDEAGTVLADISATAGGSAIAGSTITTADIAGLGPAAFRFYGPTDGTDTLYLRCPTDASLGVQEIEADEDARLDALESGSASGIPASVFDAKGDIIAATAADTAARLAVGANGTVLTAASGQATGLQWATPDVTQVELDAVNTALDARLDILETTIYVESFRAANVTDTATVIAATASVPVTGGAVLVFGPGRTYTLTAEVLVSGKDKLTVEGRGATVKASSATSWGTSSGIRHVLRFRDCTNLKLRNLTFDGNGAALTGTAGWWAMLGVDSTYADFTVATKVAANVHIEGCDFRNLRSYAFGARLVDGLTLQGCTFKQGFQDVSNPAGQAAIARSDNVAVLGCDFNGGSNTTETAGTLGTLLCVSPGDGGSGDPYTTAMNWCSVMNYLALSQFTAAPAVSGTADTTVSYTGANETTASPDYIGNDFYFLCVDAGSGTNAGIIPSSAMKVTSVNEGAKTFVVRRNAGDESGTALNWAGQKVYYYSVKTSRFCRNVVVDGCTFKHSGLYAGVFLLGCADFAITNCRGSACRDIVLDVEHCIRGTIADNTVDNPGGNTGIASLFLADDVTITGNTATRSGILLYSGYAVQRGIGVTNNRLRGSTLAFRTQDGAPWSDLVEDVVIDGNTILGGTTTAVGVPPFILLNIGKNISASYPGLFRNVQISNNILRGAAAWAIVVVGIDGLDILGNSIGDTGYDAILDGNDNWQSTRMVIEGNRFANIGHRDRVNRGVYRSNASVTDPPIFGRNIWRNTQTALDGTQRWYFPVGSAAHPTGLRNDHIGTLTLRDNAGTLQKSADTTYPGDGTWANLP